MYLAIPISPIQQPRVLSESSSKQNCPSANRGHCASALGHCNVVELADRRSHWDRRRLVALLQTGVCSRSSQTQIARARRGTVGVMPSALAGSPWATRSVDRAPGRITSRDIDGGRLREISRDPGAPAPRVWARRRAVKHGRALAGARDLASPSPRVKPASRSRAVPLLSRAACTVTPRNQATPVRRPASINDPRVTKPVTSVSIRRRFIRRVCGGARPCRSKPRTPAARTPVHPRAPTAGAGRWCSATGACARASRGSGASSRRWRRGSPP
jgi:hypothetical protein